MMKIRKSVGVFVVDKNKKFLLLKTKGENEVYWDIVKGGVERGETLLMALKRELKEELGTTKFKNIKKLDIHFTFEFPDEIKRKIGFDRQKVELFIVEFVGKSENIKVDKKEILDFVFLTPKQFLEKATYQTTKKAFLKMLKKLDL
jgi:putative (di)nucleoside polyphosphate hydrolase